MPNTLKSNLQSKLNKMCTENYIKKTVTHITSYSLYIYIF